MSQAAVTFEEIRQQPELWAVTRDLWQERREELEQFLEGMLERCGRVRVVFTGAGTSCYVGDVLLPRMKAMGDRRFSFESVATTDLVSNPEQFLQDEPTLLVSFARSGNSPESVAACELAEQRVKELYQLTITCAAEGKLALRSKGDERSRLFLLDERCNDRGFAMTSSFTDMVLAALLIFEKRPVEDKLRDVDKLCCLGRFAVEREEAVREAAAEEYKRVIYLGSGSLAALSREAQLKILELTAGRIATCFDSSMGFRHGPKSFVDEDSLIVVFVSEDAYTRQYDQDILAELRRDKIAKRVLALSLREEGDSLVYPAADGEGLADAWLALPYIIFAQFFASYSALRVKNDVDNPSAGGTVNRVVKGVTIHPYKG